MEIINHEIHEQDDSVRIHVLVNGELRSFEHFLLSGVREDQPMIAACNARTARELFDMVATIVATAAFIAKGGLDIPAEDARALIQAAVTTGLSDLNLEGGGD